MEELGKLIKPEQVRASFYKSLKNKLLLEHDKNIVTEPVVPIEKLSTKQRIVVKLVQEFLRKDDDQRFQEPLRLLVIGTAGTGKTAVISHLKTLLHRQTHLEEGFKYEILSFTGLASYNAGGTTIHSTFNVKMYKSKEEIHQMLDEEVAPVLQTKLNGCRFFIIDEISTVGKLLFRYIEICLREINKGYKNQKFGAMSFVLFGDFGQLPPIDYRLFKLVEDPEQQAAYFERQRREEEERGEVNEQLWSQRQDSVKVLTDLHSELKKSTRLYMGITNVILLDKTFRQNEDNADEKEFACFLRRLRNGTTTDEDVNLVKQRMKRNLEPQDIKSFESALHAFPTRRQVAKQNSLCLRSEFNEEAIISVPNGPHPFEFALGCNVTLRKNLSVTAGIVNGASGTIIDFYQPSDKEKAMGALEFILVRFPSYKGKIAVRTEKGVGLPIFRSQYGEIDDATGQYTTCLRYMLELGFAITVHRSQGMTLPKLCLYLGGSEFAEGLRFVGFSRVKRLDDIMILDKKVTKETICPTTVKAKNWRMVLKLEEERLQEYERKFLLKMAL